MENQNQMNLPNEKYVIIILFGLIIECPMGGNPESCQLYKARLLPLREKSNWVKNLNPRKRLEIYLKHKQCLSKKEEGYEN